MPLSVSKLHVSRHSRVQSVPEIPTPWSEDFGRILAIDVQKYDELVRRVSVLILKPRGVYQLYRHADGQTPVSGRDPYFGDVDSLFG